MGQICFLSAGFPAEFDSSLSICRLYIAGVNRWNDLERGSLQIEAALTYQIDTCDFQIRGVQPIDGEEVIIEDNSLGRLFGGIITKVELLERVGGLKLWQVECEDYTFALDREMVVETYENLTADAIFRDIVSKYCPDFTVNGVQTGAPIVEYKLFDYVYPSEAFKQLCQYTGWEWQPDYYKDLKFFNPESLGESAPITIKRGAMFTNFKHSIERQGLRNRVYVRGGTMLSDFFTYEVKTDGVSRIWNLPHKPHEISMKVSEVTKSVGIENVSTEANFDYMVNYQEKYIRASIQTITPVSGATMQFVYKYDIDVITIAEDVASQQTIAAVQGGNGVYAYSIVDDSLTTIDAAEAAGNADLREHANPRVKGSFDTSLGAFLGAIKSWQPGQLLTIDLLDRGIYNTFVVQRVALSPKKNGVWSYHIEYGGRMFGIADFLKALVSSQQQKKLNETALIHKFNYGEETTKMLDELMFTSRTPPWYIGDSDAICGFIVCSE